MDSGVVEFQIIGQSVCLVKKNSKKQTCRKGSEKSFSYSVKGNQISIYEKGQQASEESVKYALTLFLIPFPYLTIVRFPVFCTASPLLSVPVNTYAYTPD